VNSNHPESAAEADRLFVISWKRRQSDDAYCCWTWRGTRRMARIVDRYKLALLMLTITVIPLLYIRIWLGLVAVIALYALIARLANKDFDRQFQKHLRQRRDRSER
jgi:hypothetical protein